MSSKKLLLIGILVWVCPCSSSEEPASENTPEIDTITIPTSTVDYNNTFALCVQPTGTLTFNFF